MALGIALVVALGWTFSLPLQQLTSAHVVWGLLGWSLILLAGVAYMVVPMFQLTPPYKVAFALWWPPMMVALCAAWTVTVVLIPGRGLELAVGWLLAGGAAAFAIVTLSLQRKRRRKGGDSAFLFWRTGMVALIAAAVMGAIRLVLGAGEVATKFEFLLGILMICGVYTTLMNGMLYKIVPFIVWLHLQRVLVSPPTMHQVIPEGTMRGQFRLHLVAIFMLVAAVIVPSLAMPAGVLFAASCVWLELNLVRALLVYQRAKQGGVDVERSAA